MKQLELSLNKRLLIVEAESAMVVGQYEADKKEYDEAESRTFNIDKTLIFEIL